MMKSPDHNQPNDFDVYLRQSEPHWRERAEAWKTAIGLQDVDALKPSKYLIETAKRHIEGDISIDEVTSLIDNYYQGKSLRVAEDSGTEEADKVSANITRLLNERAFTFSPIGYTSIHRRIFTGVFSFAGQFRDFNITKKEWVLRGDTVLYTSAEELRSTLEYDFEQEASFNYKGLSLEAVVTHFSKFISGLWQIHPFAEGNTRTTAVFAIQYLRAMGFDVNNEVFAEHAWYFRNVLVRANYRNYKYGIVPNIEYLEGFFRNVLLGEDKELENRNLLIPPLVESRKYDTQTGQVPDKYRTSTGLVQGELVMNNPHMVTLIQVLGELCLSVREIMEALHLQHRESFLKLWLNPALGFGLIRRQYSDTPRHPRQKYLLTSLGLEMYQNIMKF